MGSSHFLTRTLDRVSTKMSLHVLAYNLKRVMNMVGIRPVIQAVQTWEACIYRTKQAYAAPRRRISDSEK